MHRDLTSKALAAKTDALEKVAKMRGVLRAPRLLKQYQDKFEKLRMEARVNNKTLKDHNDLIKNLDSTEKLLYVGLEESLNDEGEVKPENE